MLREEVRSLKDFDMSRFGLDFKSKRLDYGHERLRTDDAYNLRLVSRSDCGRDGHAPHEAVHGQAGGHDRVQLRQEHARGRQGRPLLPLLHR